VKKISLAIVLFFVAAITVTDVTLLLKGYEYTISATLYEMAAGKPIIPFIFGLLGGHLFWPNRRASDVIAEKKTP
jgi:hypothetical protein